MESKQRSNWADVSDDDSWASDSETPKLKSQPPVKSPLEDRLTNIRPPINFLLDNLKYSITNDSEIRDFFELTPEENEACEIYLIGDNGCSSGTAILKAHNKELAYKVFSFNGKSFLDRPIKIKLNSGRGPTHFVRKGARRPRNAALKRPIDFESSNTDVRSTQKGDEVEVNKPTVKAWGLSLIHI